MMTLLALLLLIAIVIVVRALANKDGKMRPEKQGSTLADDHYKDDTFEVKIDRVTKTVTFSVRTYLEGWVTRTAPLGQLQFTRKRDSSTHTYKDFIPGSTVHNVRTDVLGNVLNLPGGEGVRIGSTGQVMSGNATYDPISNTLRTEHKTYDRTVTEHAALSNWFLAVVQGGKFTQVARIHVEAASENPKFFDWLKQHESEFRSSARPEEAFPSTDPAEVRHRKLMRETEAYQRASDAKFEANRKRETKALLEQHRVWNKSGKSSWHHFE